MTLDEFLDRCEGVRPSGNGYVAVCPAHEDREASLGITEGDDGRILLQCYAGCETKDIVEVMQIRFADLFANTMRHDVLPEAGYDYTDEFGNVLFQAVRFPGKRFRQRHHAPDAPDADEQGYVWNLDGVRRVPFRLPELIAAVAAGQVVYLVEGEKDALRITQETGRFATCNPMGAGKWRDEYVPFFTNARVIIIQDRDEPGRRHAQKVKDSIGPVVQSLHVLQAKRGKDISDHFDNGFPMEDLLQPRQAPRRGIVSAADMVESGMEYLNFRPTDLPGWALLPGVEASIVRLGRLYAGGAYTGDGKTTLALQGTRTLCEQKVRCGYFSMEMPERDLRNRFIAHKGVPLSLLEEPWKLRLPENRPFLDLYHAALEEMRDWQLEVIFDSGLTAEKVVEYTLDREYEFVVIDHIHRFGWGDRRHLETQVQALTNLTLEANIAMLVLCQLRRYQRGKDMVAYPPPVLQDFRETEMIGNEASIAFALWRSRDQEGLRYEGDTSQLRVLKNRHTTSRKDQAGHIELLGFDRTTQLYSMGGMHSEYRPTEPATDSGIEDPWADLQQPDGDTTWE